MIRQIHVDRCDSTQDILKEQLTQHPHDEIMVSCEKQISGRGRGNNIWVDTEGTLCFSMGVPAHIKPSFTALEISLLVGKFFESKGTVLEMKWPNDLYRNGKKCAGILIQNSGNQMMAGIGLNIFHEDSMYGGIFEAPFIFDKKALPLEIATYIKDHRYRETMQLISDWNQRCLHMNARVKIIEGDDIKTGVFRGLGEYGEALLENEQGLLSLYNGSLRLI